MTFYALADPTRRGMLAVLAQGERSIGELAQPYAMTLAGASKHIQVLERAGLVTRRRDGRTHRCALNPAPLAEANQWLEQWGRFWNDRLDGLEALLRDTDQGETE